MAFNLTEVQAQQLNPLTPMAFLAPDVGYQATVAVYVKVGSVGALIWDIIIHVDSDYKLLFRHKIGIPTIVYFLSRASVLVWALLAVVIATMPSIHCQAVTKTFCVLYHVAFSSTALLFFLRVRAVFIQNKFIVASFALLWLGVLGTSLTEISAGKAVHLGPTSYCINTVLKPYTSASPVTLAINDTFVFLAISWRLLSNSILDHGTKLNIKSIILGKHLPAFSRALLQDGQVYYLVSITSNIAVAIGVWQGSMPLPYRTMLVVFTVLLTNMMACQVFRHTKFGNFREDTFFMRQPVSQRGLDLEGGNGNVKSQIRFVSVRSTQTEAYQSNTNQSEHSLQKGEV